MRALSLPGKKVVLPSVGFALLLAFIFRFQFFGAATVGHVFYLSPFILALLAFALSPLKLLHVWRANILRFLLLTLPVYLVSLSHFLHDAKSFNDQFVSIILALSGLAVGYLASSEFYKPKLVPGLERADSLYLGMLSLLLVATCVFFVSSNTFAGLNYESEDIYEVGYQSVGLLSQIVFLLIVWCHPYIESAKITLFAMTVSMAVFNGVIGSNMAMLSFAASSAILYLYIFSEIRSRFSTFNRLSSYVLKLLVMASPIVLYSFFEAKFSATRVGLEANGNLLGILASSSFSSRGDIRACVFHNQDFMSIYLGGKALCDGPGTYEHSILGLFFGSGLLIGLPYALYVFYAILGRINKLTVHSAAIPLKLKIVLASLIALPGLLFQAWPSVIFFFYIGLLYGSCDALSNNNLAPTAETKVNQS